MALPVGTVGHTVRKTKKSAPKPHKAPAPRPTYTLPKNFRTEAAASQPTPKQRQYINRNARKVATSVNHPRLTSTHRVYINGRPFRTSSPTLTLKTQYGPGHGDFGKRGKAGGGEFKGDTDTHIGPFNLEAELEGRGLLAKGGKAIVHAVEQHQRGEQRLNQAVYGKHPSAMQVAAGLGGGGNVAKDVTNLTTNLPSSLYLAGAAAKEAAHGRPQRAKKLAKDYGKTSAAVALAQGHVKEAGKRLEEHPASTLLEFSGIKALAGRGAGAAMRHGPSKAARRAASTERPNLRLYEDAKPGEGPEEGRAYSRDIINKGLQKYAERRVRKGSRVRRNGTQRRPGRDPHVDRGSLMVPALPGRLGGGQVRSGMAPIRSRLIRRVDTRRFQHDTVKHARKLKAARAVARIVPVTRASRYANVVRGGSKLKPHEGAGVQLAAERVIRPERGLGRVRSDLQRHKTALDREAPKLKGHPERYKRNRAAAKHVRELLSLSDEGLARVQKGAEDFAEQQKPVQARGRRVGAYDELAQSKRFFPGLQSHYKTVRGEQRTNLTSAERAAAAKKINQRIAQGKPTPAVARKAAHREETLASRPGAGHPVIPLAQAILDVAQGKVPKYPRGPATREKLSGYQREVTAKARHEGRKLTDEEAARLQRYGRAVQNKENVPIAESLRSVKVRRPTPSRLLNEEELTIVARKLQKRSRAGQHTAGHGEPTLITQRPVRTHGSGAPQGESPRVFPHPMESTHGRTGKGLLSREVGPDAVMRQAIASEAQVTGAEGFQAIAREFGRPATRDGQRYADSYDEASLTSEHLAEAYPDQPRYVPVNVAEFRTYGTKLRRKQEEGSPHPLATGATRDAMVERMAEKETWDRALNESGKGRWVLMPEDVVQRFREHAEVSTHGALHSLNNMFKDVVLTSAHPSHWLGGNVTDLTTRAVFAGITPLDIVRGAKAVRQVAREGGYEGEGAAAAVAGGGLFHSGSSLSRTFHSTAVGENPVHTVLAAPWRIWKGSIYGIEQYIEEIPQWGAVGKAMARRTGRKVPASGHGWATEDAVMKTNLKSLLKLHDAQIDHFASRLATDRAFEAQIQKITEDVIGRWGKVSPNMRRALVTAPFAQWLGAATRYVYVTLPVHHPIKTGIMAGISQMTEDERRKLGLSYYLPRNKQVQDYQMGTLPTNVSHDKYGTVVKGIRTQTLTSFGTAGGVPGNLGDFVLPQVSGAFGAWSGISFTNEKLVYPEWWPEVSLRGIELPPDIRDKVGIGMLMEGTLPFASAFKNIALEKGRSAEPYSTIITPEIRRTWSKEDQAYLKSEGTRLGGLMQWLMPFKPNSRLTTYGAAKEIHDNQSTYDTLERWAAQKKAASRIPNLRAKDDKSSKGEILDLRGKKPSPNATATPAPLIKLR